jgi:hypothetical protein
MLIGHLVLQLHFQLILAILAPAVASGSWV